MNQDIQIQLPAAVAASTHPTFVNETRNATKLDVGLGTRLQLLRI